MLCLSTPMSSSSQQHLWQPTLGSGHLLSHPWLSNQSPTAFCRPQEVWCAGFVCLQQRPVERLPGGSGSRSLRSAVLSACCPGDSWKCCWRGPSCGQGPVFPSAMLLPTASRWLCSAVVCGTTYINGGCLACAHQQRLGWGTVRIGSGALATLVPEGFP